MKCGAEMERDSYGGANCLHCGAHLDAAGKLHVEQVVKDEGGKYDLYIKIGIYLVLLIIAVVALFYFTTHMDKLIL